MQKKLWAVALLVTTLLLTGCIGGSSGARLYVTWSTQPRETTVAAVAELEAGDVEFTDMHTGYAKTPLGGTSSIAEAKVRGIDNFSDEEFDIEVFSESGNPYEVRGRTVVIGADNPDEGYVYVKFRGLEIISPFKVYPAHAIGASTDLERDLYTHFDFEAGEASDVAGDIYMTFVYAEPRESQKVHATYGYAVIPIQTGIWEGFAEADIDFESLEFEVGSFSPDFRSLYVIKTQRGYAKMFVPRSEFFPAVAHDFVYEYFPNEI